MNMHPRMNEQALFFRHFTEEAVARMQIQPQGLILMNDDEGWCVLPRELAGRETNNQAIEGADDFDVVWFQGLR